MRLQNFSREPSCNESDCEILLILGFLIVEVHST